MTSPHSAFCTTRALLSDLKNLGYNGGAHIDTTSASDLDLLDDSILRYLIAVIDPYAMVGELNMDKFFASSGLKVCAKNSTHKAKTCFLRAVIDLAASSRARRDVAAQLDFDIDAYGVFTPEDVSADNELSLLIKHREELFPSTRTKKRVRTPLARKDLSTNMNSINRKPSRKPPLPQAAKKSSHDKKNNSTSTSTSISISPTANDDPESFSKLSTVQLIRAAKKRAASANKIAHDEQVEVPPPTQTRQLSDLGFIPAIVDSDEFFRDDKVSNTDSGDEPGEKPQQPESPAAAGGTTQRGTAASATDDDEGRKRNGTGVADDGKRAASVTGDVDVDNDKAGIEAKSPSALPSPTELDKDPASDDGSVIEPPLVQTEQPPLKKVSSEVTVDSTTTISPNTSASELSTIPNIPAISNVSAAEAAAAVALRTEIDLLTTEAEEALAAVKAFEASAAPLLQVSKHNTRRDTLNHDNFDYDAYLDDELSASVLEAHQAQRELLKELRSHIKIDASYNHLQKWASKSSAVTPKLEYCRMRAEKAAQFSQRIENDRN